MGSAIPLALEVDVLVAGGGSGAVAAAAAAAEAGASVFLAAPRPYLGDDLCGSLRLWPLERDDAHDHPLARALYAPLTGAAGRLALRPLHVKRVMDDALLDAGVRFLYGCFPVGLLRDATGRPAGMVMANRAGLQAVAARIVVDATAFACVARMAGAAFTPPPAGPWTFRRVVVGPDKPLDTGMAARRLDAAFVSAGRSFSAVEYELRLSAGTWDPAGMAAAEQAARDLTFSPELVDESEQLAWAAGWHVRGDAHAGGWGGAAALDLRACRPAGVERVLVLGGLADVDDEGAEGLQRPAALIAAGARVGKEAAREALALQGPRGLRAEFGPGVSALPGEIRETADGPRPGQRGRATVPAHGADAAPVLGEFDVVVVGGGTAGAPAAVSAARAGARTLVVEYLNGLGGVATLGLIGSYYHGYRGGFTAEIDRGVAGLGAKVSVMGKTEWYRRQLRQHGAAIWYGALACGAVVDGGAVRGVVLATPQGRGVVLARTVVDATGNADVAAAAGAECEVVSARHAAVQGAGLPARELGASYTNSDFTFIEDSDAVDVWHATVCARRKYEGAYDLGQLPDTRERRRIVGDHTLTPLDMMNERTYADTLVMSKSDFDSHGFTVHPFFMLAAPDRKERTVYTPMRCLLPRGLEGIFVTGLAVSAHRDAVPVIRMQPDLQNQGYAVGLAAAAAAASGAPLRALDVKALQRALVAAGCLPETVLSDGDVPPISDARVAEAVRGLADGWDGLAVVLERTDAALPLLRAAWAAAAAPEAKRRYAHVLGMVGDDTGAETLAACVREGEFDRGWNFRGMGQFGMSLSPLDSLIIALGRTRSPLAVAPLLAKARRLDADKELSHHRAVAVALETLGDPAAAPVLADVLSKPFMSGHAAASLDAALRQVSKDPCDNTVRTRTLAELMLARALFRCGDHQGVGEQILRQYAQDLRGYYARHAQAVLDAGPGPARDSA